MQIVWHGHSCFTLKNSKTTVITDPYSSEIGLKLPKLTANIVTCSHNHPGHNNFKELNGDFLLFDCPGEYEAKEVAITGVASWHNPKDEKDRGPNTIFSFTIDGLNICHLGDLGHVLTAEQNDEIGDVDILLVPVGGVSTLNTKKVSELIDKIDPRIVIPMHYKMPSLKFELGSLEDFIKELGVPVAKRETTLKIEKKDLPKDDEDLQLVVLEAILA